MNTLLKTAAVVLMLSPAAAFASSDSAPSTETAQSIRTMLTEQGYEVRKIQSEDGLYEAYALKDGRRYEIYLDANLNIVRVGGED